MSEGIIPALFEKVIEKHTWASTDADNPLEVKLHYEMRRELEQLQADIIAEIKRELNPRDETKWFISRGQEKVLEYALAKLIGEGK